MTHTCCCASARGAGDETLPKYAAGGLTSRFKACLTSRYTYDAFDSANASSLCAWRYSNLLSCNSKMSGASPYLCAKGDRWGE